MPPLQYFSSMHDEVQVVASLPAYVPPPLPLNEARRIDALRRLEILDTLPEQCYDDLANLAARLCDVPIALISLVDSERQWFKACVGLGGSETSRDVSFCGHAIANPTQVFLVPDALEDPRFRGNPFVTGDPWVRFYAGAPIVLAGGEAMGTVCVLDTRPRELTAAQIACLEAIARQAASLLELRRMTREAVGEARDQVQATAVAEDRHAHNEQLLEFVLQGGELGLWDLDLPSGKFETNRRELELFGLTEADVVPGFDWRRLIHRDDMASLHRAIRDHVVGRTPHYEVRVRCRHRDGRWIWLLNRAVVVEADDKGVPIRIVGMHRDVTAEVEAETIRREQERALASAHAMQQRTSALASVGGWQLDLRTGVAEWTDAVFAIHDLPRDGSTVSLDDALAYYPVASRERIEECIRAAIEDGESYDIEVPMTTATGRTRWIHAIGDIGERDEHGKVVKLVGAIQDITERKEAQLRMAESERRLRGIADNLPVLISEVDAGGRFRFANATFGKWFGVDPVALVGKHKSTMGQYAEGRRAEMDAALRGESAVFEREADLSCGRRVLRSTYIPQRTADGRVDGFIGMTTDITDQKNAEQKLEALATQDALTGLPNRRLFERRMGDTLERGRRTAFDSALLFVDIDHFKSINDSQGHAAGDDLLRQVAERMRAQVRDTDLVARYAGDEFVVVLQGPIAIDHAESVGRKLADVFAVPFTCAGRQLYVTASIGVSCFSGKDTMEAALSRADRAVYIAKERGRAQMVSVRF